MKVIAAFLSAIERLNAAQVEPNSYDIYMQIQIFMYIFKLVWDSLLTGGFSSSPAEDEAPPVATSHLSLVPPAAASPFMYL